VIMSLPPASLRLSIPEQASLVGLHDSCALRRFSAFRLAILALLLHLYERRCGRFQIYEAKQRGMAHELTLILL
jgi:hypothetical protein